MSGETSRGESNRERDEHYVHGSEQKSERLAERLESLNKLIEKGFANLEEGRVIETTPSSASNEDIEIPLRQEDNVNIEVKRDNMDRRQQILPKVRALDFYEEQDFG